MRNVNRRLHSPKRYDGSALDLWRRYRGWSYSDLARAIQVTPQAARRYCLGDRMPTQEILVRLKTLTNGRVTADSFHALTGTAADFV